MKKHKSPEYDSERVIDPDTGRDITSEYVGKRLLELDDVANAIIRDALDKYRDNAIDRQAIYIEAHEEIINKLGMGSIGPATAAAAPLIRKKLELLAVVLDIDDKQKI